MHRYEQNFLIICMTYLKECTIKSTATPVGTIMITVLKKKEKEEGKEWIFQENGISAADDLKWFICAAL